MDGNEFGKAITSMLISLILGSLIAGALLVLAVQRFWPIVKEWIRWATS